MAPPAIRSFKVGEAAVDLATNILEANAERMQKAGIDITGLSLLPAVAGKAVQDFLRTHPSLLPFLETGFKQMVFATMNLNPEQRMAVGSVIDTYVDGVRKAYLDTDDSKAEGDLMLASGEFKKNLAKALDELEKRKTAKVPFPKLEEGLTPAERRALLIWVSWMKANSPDLYDSWMKYRERIEKTERLAYVLELTHQMADPEPVPPRVLPAGFDLDLFRDSHKRVTYLEEIYGGTSSWAEQLKDSLLGRDTADTRRLKAQVDETTAGMNDYTRETCKNLARKDDAERPIVVGGYAVALGLGLIALVMFAVVLFK